MYDETGHKRTRARFVVVVFMFLKFAGQNGSLGKGTLAANGEFKPQDAQGGGRTDRPWAQERSQHSRSPVCALTIALL